MRKKLIVSVCCAVSLVTSAFAICWIAMPVTCYTAGQVLVNGPSDDCYGREFFVWSVYINSSFTGTDCNDYNESGAWSCFQGKQDYIGVWCTKVTRMCTELGILEVSTQEQESISCDKAELGDTGCIIE